jgi:hypothetical protein
MADLEIYLDILFVAIIVIGILGNMLNIFVLSAKSMGSTTTFSYLKYLAIVDLLVLLVCSSDTLFTFGFDLQMRLRSSISCKSHTFLTYYLSHFSSVLITVVNIDRTLIMYDKVFFKLNNVKMLVAVLAAVLVLFNCHFLFFFELYSNIKGMYSFLGIHDETLKDEALNNQLIRVVIDFNLKNMFNDVESLVKLAMLNVTKEFGTDYG